MSDDVIVSDADFYNNLSNTNLEPTDDDDDDDDDDEQMSDGETEDDSDTEMEHEETEDAQPPTKKAKLADVLSLGNVCGREFAEAEADEFVTKLSTKQLDLLLQKMIKRKQNESGDEEGLALIYKNTKNNKNMLLESFGEEITSQLIKQYPIQTVQLKIAKKKILPEADYVGVVLTRSI